MNMRLPKYLRDRDPQQTGGLPHLEAIPAETAEIAEAEWMAAALDAFEQQVEQVLMEEAWIESCIEQMIAEENYEPVWEMSPQNPNISFVHSIVVIQHDGIQSLDPVTQLPLFTSTHVMEHRQSMGQPNLAQSYMSMDKLLVRMNCPLIHKCFKISHSMLNPDAPEFIPRGKAAP